MGILFVGLPSDGQLEEKKRPRDQQGYGSKCIFQKSFSFDVDLQVCCLAVCHSVNDNSLGNNSLRLSLSARSILLKFIFDETTRAFSEL